MSVLAPSATANHAQQDRARPFAPNATGPRKRDVPRTAKRRTKRKPKIEAHTPLQLPLTLVVPTTPLSKPRPPSLPTSAPDRLSGLDQRMTTHDVLRILGVNRSTLFRWTRKGLFPAKHVSGGWLRSDVERWFSSQK